MTVRLSCMHVKYGLWVSDVEYLCKEVDLKACSLVGFRLAVVQIVPHCQHKLNKVFFIKGKKKKK